MRVLSHGLAPWEAADGQGCQAQIYGIDAEGSLDSGRGKGAI